MRQFIRAADAKLDCAECRKEYDDQGSGPPCDFEILPDGTCCFGMPEMLPENRLALDLYADIKAFGWEAASELHGLEMTPYDRGDLLMKLRVIAAEIAIIEREKMQASAAGG